MYVTLLAHASSQWLMTCQATRFEGRTLECRAPSSEVGNMDYREFGFGA